MGINLAKLLFLTGFIAGLSFAATPEKTGYSNISNRELKESALRIVKHIRDRVDSYNKKDRDLMEEYNKNLLATRTDERKELKNRWLKESDVLHDITMRYYSDSYRAAAISLVKELYRRLPSRFRQTKLPPIYQNPTNVIALEAIADHLELIAKSLPDS